MRMAADHASMPDLSARSWLQPELLDGSADLPCQRHIVVENTERAYAAFGRKRSFFVRWRRVG